MGSSVGDGEGAAFVVDLDSGEVERMQEITLASAGLRERDDLQRWLTTHPELIASDLLLITTEFDRWEIRDQKVADRLDALFVDPTGAPVVAEFKRDKASDTVELQAFKYAAYCSQLTLEDLVEEFAAYHSVELDIGRQRLLDHAPVLEDRGPRSIKIRLVAGSFGPAVTSVVLWLREYGLDIGCVEVSVRKGPDSRHVVLTSRQLLPLPDAEDYLVRRRRKEQEEERSRLPTEWSWDGYAENFAPEQVAIVRRLWDRITHYVEENELLWTPVLRSWWLGYQRPGGYYVPVIDLHSKKPIGFSVKLPDDPTVLGVENPYPHLEAIWRTGVRQWTWEVPTLDHVPDVATAIDISRKHQPTSGPMRPPTEPPPGQ